MTEKATGEHERIAVSHLAVAARIAAVFRVIHEIKAKARELESLRGLEPIVDAFLTAHEKTYAPLIETGKRLQQAVQRLGQDTSKWNGRGPGDEVFFRSVWTLIKAAGYSEDEFSSMHLAQMAEILEHRADVLDQLKASGIKMASPDLLRKIKNSGGKPPSKIPGIDGVKVRALVDDLKSNLRTSYEQMAECIGISKDTLDRAFKGHITTDTWDRIVAFAEGRGKTITLDQLR